MNQTERNPQSRIRTIMILALAPLCAVLAYHSSLGFGYLGDSVFLIRDNVNLRGLHQLWDNLTRDYFWASSGEQIGYWRPVTKVSWLLEYLIGQGWPGIHHLVQVLWFLAAILGVQALAMALGATPVWAAVAGVLAALHPAAVEPVCLIMARSDVVAAAAGIWALVTWRWWLQSGRVPTLLAHFLALILTLGSKEVGVVLLPLIWGWALLDHGNHPRKRLVLSLLPVLGLTGLYLLLRSLVVTSGPAVSPDPLRLLVGFGLYLGGLFPFRLETGIRNLALTESREIMTLVRAGLGCLVFLAALTAALVRRRWSAAALLLWIPLALAPVLLVEQIGVPGVAGKLPLADRWLLQPVLAAAVLVGLLEPFFSRHALLLPLSQLLLVVWIPVAMLLASGTHGDYRDELSLMAMEDRRFEAIPQAHRTPQDVCRFLERDLARQTAAKDADKALALARAMEDQGCSLSGDPGLNLLSTLVGQARYPEARPLADRLLKESGSGRARGWLLYMIGATYVHTGAPGQGLVLLDDAAAMGVNACGLDLARAQALMQLNRSREAAAAFEQTNACLIATRGQGAAELLEEAARLRNR